MQHNTPIIATACEGPKEICEDGVDAMLVPKEEPRALADAIGCLQQDETMRKNLVTQAARTVEQYDISRVAAQLEAALHTWQ